MNMIALKDQNRAQVTNHNATEMKKNCLISNSKLSYLKKVNVLADFGGTYTKESQ